MWEHPCVDCAGLVYFVQRLFQYGYLLPLPAVCAGHCTLDRECGDAAALPAPRAPGSVNPQGPQWSRGDLRVFLEIVMEVAPGLCSQSSRRQCPVIGSPCRRKGYRGGSFPSTHTPHKQWCLASQVGSGFLCVYPQLQSYQTPDP